MALQQVFSLTPTEPYLVTGSGHWARMDVYGVTNFYPPAARDSFDQQHASDELYFYQYTSGDAAANYAAWNERRRVPQVILSYDLSDFEPHKEVALTLRFDALSESRVLIYTNAGLLDDETLHVGDDQLLIEVESTDFLYLYFIHANRDGSAWGGTWFFSGIDGYIA